jgi:hypothetical protein
LDEELKIWKMSSQRDVLNIVPIANEIDEDSLEELEHHPNLVIFALGTEEASNQFDRLVWVNPFNFEAVEKFIVILLSGSINRYCNLIQKLCYLVESRNLSEMNLFASLC